MSNFNTLLNIISKWPVNEKTRIINYGNHLKGLIKNKDIYGNVFPGNMVENTEKLNSLMRLVSNVYHEKYPNEKNIGASGIPVQSLEKIISDEFYEYFKKKSSLFK